MSDAPSDLDLARLIATRLNHDLAGPLGAVVNGAELMGGDPSFAAEGAGLLTASAKAAAIRLKVLRAAFGTSGEKTPEMGALPAVLREYFAATRAKGAEIALEWGVETATTAGMEALMLNMCLLAADCLPRGGALSVGARDGEVVMIAVGRGAAARPDLLAAAAGAAEGLTARAVQAYWTARLAAEEGLALSLSEAGDGEIRIEVAPRAANNAAASAASPA